MKNMEILTGIYRHFKGGEYRVIGIAKHSETLEDLVIYEPLYENSLSKLWARPLDEFLAKVERDGKMIERYRFLRKD